MHNYFEGWYFKCQDKDKTLALIPARHRFQGKTTCSLQVITDEKAFFIPLPWERLTFDKGNFTVRFGENQLGQQGIRLNLEGDGCRISGALDFGRFSPIASPIMGPFRLVPFLHCRHDVFSMSHRVTGEITVNGKVYAFSKGRGYIEGDRGRSFPPHYAWTHCFFPGGSLMACAAEIRPFGFTGVLGLIHFQGKEYRLATYLGAKAVKIQDGELVIRQGNWELRCTREAPVGHLLRAPEIGAMRRLIRESPSCDAFYSFRVKGQTVFSFATSRASFEFEYP